MKSISIHGIDETLDSLIKERARSQGQSLNKTIKQLLEAALGLRPKNPEEKSKEFSDLFGIWSDEELHEFEKKTEDLNKVNMEDWL